MRKSVLPFRKPAAGYTLLEMAVAIIILGVLAAAFLQVYSLYSQNQKMLKTQQLVNTATSEIQTYRQVFGHYPCPAPIDALRTDIDYGTETNCSDAATIPAGNCANGICIRSTTRLVDHDNDPVTAPINMTLRVRIGAIPFRVLQMDEKETFDSYGSRLTYAVTEAMGTVTGFQELRGGIDLVDEGGQSLIQPAGSASFVILSHGINRVGGYASLSGNQVPCAGSGLDLTNCIDPLVVAVPPDARFANSFAQNATAATTFDDIVAYFATAKNPMWRRVTPGSEDIVDMSGNLVGIGTSTPSDTLSVTQTTVNPATGTMEATNALTASGVTLESGAVRARTDIRSDTYCDQTDTNCFQTKDFIGDPDLGVPTGGVKCPVGYIAALTSNGTNAVPDCQPVRAMCPTGKVFTGMVNGVPQCEVPAVGCAAQSVNVCASPVVLAATGVSGFVQNVTGGDCRSENYTCNNGAWIGPSGISGHCVNTSTTGLACAAGYTGTYTSFACGGNTAAADCVCTGLINYPENLACAAPFTGGVKTRTCSRVCVAGVLQPPVCTPYVGVCACAKSDYWEFANCPVNFQRKALPVPAAFAAPADVWPAAIAKGQYRKRTVNLGTCTYDALPFDSSNCVCAGIPQYTAIVDPPVPPPYPAPAVCWEALTSRDVYDGATLAIANVKHDKVVKKTPRDAACNLDPGAATILPDPAIYTKKPYVWRQVTATPSAVAQSSPGAFPIVNDPCDCVTDSTGPAVNCATPDGSGTYNIYSCKCQP